MIKVAKILGAAVLVGVLAACGEIVSFKNAELWEGGTQFLSESGTTLTIGGVLAKPEGKGPFPAVVLLHTCGGLQPRFIEDWPDYLTGLGYVTLSVDSFGPRGISRCPGQPSTIALTKDAYGALDYLASLPFVDKERIGVMGFSMGGNTIDYFVGQGFKTPSGLNFKAAVKLYSSCANLFGYATDPIIPTMVIHGDLDIRTLHICKAVAGISPYIKVHILPDTYHAFDAERHFSLTYDYYGNPMKYSEKATNKARELTKAYLAEHLGKR